MLYKYIGAALDFLRQCNTKISGPLFKNFVLQEQISAEISAA